MVTQMHETRKIDYINLLQQIGVKCGDNIMLHADLRMFGRVEGGFDTIIDEILTLVGPTGTIVTPSFTFTFPRVFDPLSSRSKIGGLTSLFARQANVVRVPDGMTSYYIIGQRSHELINNWDNTSYGDSSILGQMIKLNGSVIQFDTDILSLVHYIEQKVKVPYRELKRFQGDIIKNGVPVLSHTDFYARIRDVTKIIPDPIRSVFYDKKATQIEFNGRVVRSFKMTEFVDFGIEKLSKNNMLLVE